MDPVTAQAPSPCPSLLLLSFSIFQSLHLACLLAPFHPLCGTCRVAADWHYRHAGTLKRIAHNSQDPCPGGGPLQARSLIRHTMYEEFKTGKTQRGEGGGLVSGKMELEQQFRCKLTAPLTFAASAFLIWCLLHLPTRFPPPPLSSNAHCVGGSEDCWAQHPARQSVSM